MGPSVYTRAFAFWQESIAAGFPLVLAVESRAVRIPSQAPAELKEQLRAFLGSHEGREGSPSYRAMVRTLSAPSLAVRELLCVPVRCLGSYPVAYTARGVTYRSGGTLAVAPASFVRPEQARPGLPVTTTRWAWSTSRKGFEALLAGGTSAFSAKELERAAWALEQGRVNANDFTAWCGHKVGRDWVLSAQAARCDVAAYREGETFSSISLGELLDGFSADLLGVELHEKKEGPTH
jgi:hypothetical protein